MRCWRNIVRGNNLRNIVCALSALAVMAVAPIASASEPVRVVVAGQEDVDPQERALAARIVALTTPDFEKQILSYLSTMFAQMGSEAAAAPEMAWFEKNAGPLMIPHLRTLMTEIEIQYARGLTIAELEAMVAFYDTPMGHSIARKQLQLGMDMGGPIEAMQTAYLASLMERFCAENDCSGIESAAPVAGKSGRR